MERWVTEPQSMRPVAAAASWQLPQIESVGALAEWLNLGVGELEWFADLKGFAYRPDRSPLSHYNYRILTKNRARFVSSKLPRLV